MIGSEPTMIGLSDVAHGLLLQMKVEKSLAEMADGYRLALSLALFRGIVPPEIAAPRKTIFSVATIDPDQEVAAAIRALMDLDGGSVYRMAERLAEWGIHEMASQFEGGPLDVAKLLEGALPRADKSP